MIICVKRLLIESHITRHYTRYHKKPFESTDIQLTYEAHSVIYFFASLMKLHIIRIMMIPMGNALIILTD